MAEKKKCPKCGSGNCYVLVGGKVVCRNCGYDERTAGKNKEAKNMKSNTENALSPIVGTLLMIAIVIILAAIIGAFVFGVAGEQKVSHTAGFSVDTTPDGKIGIGYKSNGGDDVAITSLDIYIGEDKYTYATPKVGDYWAYVKTGTQTHVKIFATYEDGVVSPVLERYI